MRENTSIRTFAWETITIRDNYMFATVFRDPELCRELLQIVLDRSVERVVLVESEASRVPELGAKGIRMDVYVADGSGTVYDVEMQNANEGDLARRSRYYLSANDMDCMAPGMDYDDMRESFVIFVCSFDPFGRDLPRYNIVPCCREDGVEMLDGAARLFVNATAWDKCADPRLAAFLRYLCNGTIGEDGFTREVDDAVQRTKQMPDWRRRRMKLERYLEEQRVKAIKEGLAEGRAKGLAEGREEGRVEGLAEGRVEGRAEGRAEGREQERATIARLAATLSAAGRGDELVPALSNGEALERLLQEFGLADEMAASAD